MSRRWPVIRWISRVLLVFPIGLFGFIGWRYLTNPIGTAGLDLISLGSPAAVTDMRVIGALFFACGLVTTFYLSTERLLAGLAFVLTVVSVVTAARAFGLWTDGPAPGTVSKLTTEFVLLTIFIVGSLAEFARDRNEHRVRTRV
jgi:hypothetical protein